MNVDTGELISGNLLETFSDLLKEKYQQVPDELAEEANRELDGKDKTVVDMTKETQLVKWAKTQQGAKNKKHSNLKKMQKTSKRKNRKGR